MLSNMNPKFYKIISYISVNTFIFLKIALNKCIFIMSKLLYTTFQYLFTIIQPFIYLSYRLLRNHV